MVLSAAGFLCAIDEDAGRCFATANDITLVRVITAMSVEYIDRDRHTYRSGAFINEL